MREGGWWVEKKENTSMLVTKGMIIQSGSISKTNSLSATFKMPIIECFH